MQQARQRTIPEAVHAVCRHIGEHGGRAWLVGGSVRDLLLGHRPKDFDLEVYGLDAPALLQAVQRLGRAGEVGRQFGVVKLWFDDMEIDLALPRTESKQGSGHRGFAVSPDPQLDERTAAARRDFTINAMMLDPLTDELLDFYDGQADLRDGVLRHVSAAFAEDPLRPLRGMQFAARFDLRLHPDTAGLCRTLLPEAATLPAARIWEEWRKWSHAAHPSRGLEALQDSGWLTLYPQLAALVGCEQDAEWHPEGDVWTHTLLVVDCAARVAMRRGWHGKRREQLLFAALCHDLGKPESTVRHDSGRIRSSGHSQAGLPPSSAFLQAIAAPQQLQAHVLPLVAEHLVHLHGQPTARAVRRLAHRLQPAGIELWEALVEADASGRPPIPPGRPAEPWLAEAERMSVHDASPEALASGDMLIELGMPPGPAMGRMLDAAYQAQLDGEFDDTEGARLWLSQKLERD